MSLMQDKFLPTGRYIITNVQYDISIAFDEEEERLSTTSAHKYEWNISLLNNKKWVIQGPNNISPEIGPDPEEGEDIASARKPRSPRQWVIKRTSNHEQYIIYSSSQAHLFWSLPNGDAGCTPQWSSDHESPSSRWKFKQVIEEEVVYRPKQSECEGNRFSVIVPPGWLATVAAASCTTNRWCQIRVRRNVNGIWESKELCSQPSNSDFNPMVATGSETNDIALCALEGSYKFLLDAFCSNIDPQTKKNAAQLLSTSLHSMAISRPNDQEQYPDYQIYTITVASAAGPGSQLVQDSQTHTAIVTVCFHAKPGFVGSVPDNEDRVARFSMMDGSGSSVNPEQSMLYYRVYNKNGPIATKRPAFLNNLHIGRIYLKWVPPPYNADSVRRCLAAMESIDYGEVRLFANASGSTPLEDDATIQLNGLRALGSSPKDPLILLSNVDPGEGLQLETSTRLIPPEKRSPISPRYLYYALFSDAGATPSKQPISSEEDWISRIDLDDVFPLTAASSVERLISVREQLFIPPKLFLNRNEPTPLPRDYIFAQDGQWPGPNSQNPLIVVALKRFRHSFLVYDDKEYRIQNCATKGFMLVEPVHAEAASGSHYTVHHSPSFKFKADSTGAIAFCTQDQVWAADKLSSSSSTEQYFNFVSSDGNRDEFFICAPGTQLGLALYDTGIPLASKSVTTWCRVGTQEFDKDEQRQMWRLVPSDIAKANKSS